jgi:shikimate 5-dehydrogenase
MPPFPEAAIGEHTICYDLSYSMKTTPFSSWAKEHGAALSVMGGVRPDTAAVLKQVSAV